MLHAISLDKFSGNSLHSNKAFKKLKQTERAGFKTFWPVLNIAWFSNPKSDSGLYNFENQNKKVYLLVYAHDIVVMKRHTAKIIKIIEKIQENFQFTLIETCLSFDK